MHNFVRTINDSKPIKILHIRTTNNKERKSNT